MFKETASLEAAVANEAHVVKVFLLLDCLTMSVLITYFGGTNSVNFNLGNSGLIPFGVWGRGRGVFYIH